MSEFETVLRTPELGPGDITQVQVHGHDLAVATVGQTYYALYARCPVSTACRRCRSHSATPSC